MAALGLWYFAQAFSSFSKQGLLCCSAWGSHYSRFSWIQALGCMGFSHIQASIIEAHWFSWSAACRIFLGWGLNPCLGEGNGNPLQYSCLENPMDGGAWWTIWVAKSWTRLSNFTFTSLSLLRWQADSYPLRHQEVSGWWFLHSCTKVFLGPETFPYRKVRSSHSQCWAKHLFANIFSLQTGSMCMSLFCLSGTWPTPPLLSVPGERERGPPPAAWEGSRQTIFLCQMQDGTCWPWEHVLTLNADLALFSL